MSFKHTLKGNTWTSVHFMGTPTPGTPKRNLRPAPPKHTEALELASRPSDMSLPPGGGNLCGSQPSTKMPARRAASSLFFGGVCLLLAETRKGEKQIPRFSFLNFGLYTRTESNEEKNKEPSVLGRRVSGQSWTNDFWKAGALLKHPSRGIELRARRSC